jgi:hypothetical protein
MSMSIVRNNKTSPITLPAGRVMITFKPGAHEYPDALLQQIDSSRKSHRAYMQPGPKGQRPVLELNPEDVARADPPQTQGDMSAAEMVAMCKSSSDVALLTKLAAEDTRKTVVSAAAKRLVELEDAAKDSGGPAAGGIDNSPSSPGAGGQEGNSESGAGES